MKARPAVLAAVLAASAFCGALCAQPAQAGPPGGWSEMFSPRQVLGALVQYGVFALRTKTNLTYSGLSVDPVENRATIYDLELFPTPTPRSDLASCRVGIDRVTIKGAPLGQTSPIRMSAEISGLSFAPSCNLRPPFSYLAVVKLDQLVIPRIGIDLRYDIPSGGATVLGHALIDGLGMVSFDAAFDYLALGPAQGGLMREPAPVASLSRLEIRFDDGGAWTRAAPMLSEQFTNPATGPARVVAILDSLRPQVLGQTPPPDATAAMDRFAVSVKEAAAQFLADPRTLVIETGFDPSAPVMLDLAAYGSQPGRALADLQPVLSVRSTQAAKIAPLASLSAVLSDDSLGDEERRAVGLALLSGLGAPRNESLALQVLSGLSTGTDAKTALEIARRLSLTDPARAYPFALSAGAANEPGAVALLDDIEPALPPQTLFAAQPGLDALTGEPPATVAAMRDLAAGYFDGSKGRSYVLAAYWARLAAAAGDSASAFLLDDIADRIRALGATEEWQKLEEAIATRAVEDWVDGGIAARLGLAPPP